MQFPTPNSFNLGANFNFATDSLFTQITEDFTSLPPPIPGIFLELEGDPFLLLDGGFLVLL